MLQDPTCTLNDNKPQQPQHLNCMGGSIRVVADQTYKEIVLRIGSKAQRSLSKNRSMHIRVCHDDNALAR